MPRRVTLPGADELFRSTAPGVGAVPGAPGARADDLPASSSAAEAVALPRDPVERPRAERRPSSQRQRHDEKITVYISATELVELEQARLTLRADYGLAVDRGRIVREALAVVLADLEAKGEQSILVRRLRTA